MAFLIYGSKRATIGYDEFLVKCPSCEGHSWADGSVYANYYHIFWIPIFPYEKEVFLICQKCGLRRYEVPFTPDFIGDFDNVKRKFRYPWYTYFALLFIGLLVAIAIVTTVFDRDN